MNQSDFLAAALRNPVSTAISDQLFHLRLPDAWIVAGCLVQTVWNGLTNRAPDYGISDYDVFISIPTPLGRLRSRDPAIAEPIRKPWRQGRAARVHLWYPRSTACPTRRWRLRRRHRPLPAEIRRWDPPDHDTAPDGFNDIAGMIVRPNPGPNFSAANYAAKAARWKGCGRRSRCCRRIQRVVVPANAGTHTARSIDCVKMFETSYPDCAVVMGPGHVRDCAWQRRYRTTPEINPPCAAAA